MEGEAGREGEDADGSWGVLADTAGLVEAAAPDGRESHNGVDGDCRALKGTFCRTL